MAQTGGALRDPWRMKASDPEVVIVDGTPYSVHPYGGGLVARTATVGPHVFVGPDACVREHAVVVGSVRLFDKSVVEGFAIVTDLCTLRDYARVSQQAVLRGSVIMTGKSRADGTVRISGGVQLRYFAHVSDGIYTGGMSIS